MGRLYLYAVLNGRPTAPLGPGLCAEPLSLVTAGPVVAVVGAMEEPPAATAESVRGHDAVVRRLADISEAILPARFGAVQDEAALRESLASAADGLARALALVAGREQMTLHVFDGGTPVPPVPVAEAASSLGPGARYLED